MPTGAEYKQRAQDRIKTADALVAAGEWGMAAYMLGFVLECALKAAACKALYLAEYPQGGKGIENWFLTHNFDRLLVVSGTSDLFAATSANFGSWSGFTQEYQDDGWPNIRYTDMAQFTKEKVEQLRAYLVDAKSGILTLIEQNNRW